MLQPILTQEEKETLRGLVAEAQRVVVVCHQNPDGDAIGSSLALAGYLRRACGKEPVVIVPDQYPDYLHWLPGSEKIIRYDKHKERADMIIKTADLVFCLDYNTLSRTDKMASVLAEAKAKRVLIDHHLDPDIETALTISHPEASSTSELVFRVVWQTGAFDTMDKHFATHVYCGMMTDTGAFTYNSDSCDIYFIISQLLTKRINKDRIYRNVYHNYSEDRLRLMGFAMLEKLVVDAERHASYFTLTREDLKHFHFLKGDAEGLVNMPLQIKGQKLSVSLREDTEKDRTIWVSLRSVDDFPCNKMAEQFFNGGGHLNASGGRLNATMDEAIEVVRRAFLAFDEKLRK